MYGSTVGIPLCTDNVTFVMDIRADKAVEPHVATWSLSSLTQLTHRRSFTDSQQANERTNERTNEGRKAVGHFSLTHSLTVTHSQSLSLSLSLTHSQAVTDFVIAAVVASFVRSLRSFVRSFVRSLRSFLRSLRSLRSLFRLLRSFTSFVNEPFALFASLRFVHFVRSALLFCCFRFALD